MAATTTTTYASTIQTIWEKELLKVAEGYLIADKFANTSMVGKGEGNTVRVNRILRPANVTSAATSGTLIAPASAKALTSNHIDFTMENWGDSFGFNEDVDVQSFVSDPKNRAVIGNSMARTLDYQVMKKMATQCLRHRVDNDTTYEVSGTADSGSTTTLVDDALDQADDAWNGGFACMTGPEGEGYDVCTKVSDFVASSDTLTVAAHTKALSSTSKYHLTVGTGIVAGDKLSSDSLLRVSAMHELLETEKFGGGTFRAFIDSAQHADLWTDDDFKNSAIYDQAERFGTFKLVKWFDIEFMITSQLYRESVAGVEAAGTGAVHVGLVFGNNSYTVIRYGNPGGQGKFAVKFYVVDTPDSQNLRNSAKWLSWKGFWAGGVTRATSIIGLMTGATSQNLVV